jgi:hypothetical protein
MTQVIITCERDRYEASVQEPGSNGAFQTSGQYDTPLGAVVSLAASLFDNWMDELAKREKLEGADKNDQPVWTPEHGLHQGTTEDEA